jgi:short-subunit dehydrogenase
LALAKAGAHIIATARSEKALVSLDDEIRAATGQNFN